MDASPPATAAPDWLGYAEGDLRAAKSLLRASGPSPRHAGWLAEQAVEKVLHAALLAAGIEPPQTHDLDSLRDALPAEWGVRQEFPDLSGLNTWFTADVYPGDWARVLDEQAEAVVERAEQIVVCVRDDLRRRGVTLR
jgi:HEPN domain-containing protein